MTRRAALATVGGTAALASLSSLSAKSAPAVKAALRRNGPKSNFF